MTGIHKVQARGVGACVQEETLDTFVFFEFLDAVAFIDGRVSDAETLECFSDDIEELLELGKHDTLGTRVSST